MPGGRSQGARGGLAEGRPALAVRWPEPSSPELPRRPVPRRPTPAFAWLSYLICVRVFHEHMVLQVVLAEVLLGAGVALEGAIAEGGLGVPLHPRLAEDHWDAARDLRGGWPADGQPTPASSNHNHLQTYQIHLPLKLWQC